MRPARIFLGTPIRTYKCIYKGQFNTGKLLVYLLHRPVHPTGPAAVHIYVYYMGRPAPYFPTFKAAPVRSNGSWPALADRR